MSNWVPETQLEKALCPIALAKTLGLQRQDYWEELNPILKKWKSVNDGHCLVCTRLIRVNMARHLRLIHTTYVCFWRCPVVSCSLWFTSELNAKYHIEGIHHFREGHGTSFYECLRQYGMEWFGKRTFFDGRRWDRSDVGKITSPSGGGDTSSPGWSRQLISISFMTGHINKNFMCGCPVTQWLHWWRYPDIYYYICNHGIKFLQILIILLYVSYIRFYMFSYYMFR